MRLWGCLTYYGVASLVILDGKKNSKKYINTLDMGLISVAADIFGEQTTWVFQQDNAPIHISHISRQWLREHSVRTLP